MQPPGGLRVRPGGRRRRGHGQTRTRPGAGTDCGAAGFPRLQGQKPFGTSGQLRFALGLKLSGLGLGLRGIEDFGTVLKKHRVLLRIRVANKLRDAEKPHTVSIDGEGVGVPAAFEFDLTQRVSTDQFTAIVNGACASHPGQLLKVGITTNWFGRFIDDAMYWRSVAVAGSSARRLIFALTTVVIKAQATSSKVAHDFEDAGIRAMNSVINLPQCIPSGVGLPAAQEAIEQGDDDAAEKAGRVKQLRSAIGEARTDITEDNTAAVYYVIYNSVLDKFDYIMLANDGSFKSPDSEDYKQAKKACRKTRDGAGEKRAVRTGACGGQRTEAHRQHQKQQTKHVRRFQGACLGGRSAVAAAAVVDPKSGPFIMGTYKLMWEVLCQFIGISKWQYSTSQKAERDGKKVPLGDLRSGEPYPWATLIRHSPLNAGADGAQKMLPFLDLMNAGQEYHGFSYVSTENGVMPKTESTRARCEQGEQYEEARRALHAAATRAIDADDGALSAKLNELSPKELRKHCLELESRKLLAPGQVPTERAGRTKLPYIQLLEAHYAELEHPYTEFMEAHYAEKEHPFKGFMRHLSRDSAD